MTRVDVELWRGDLTVRSARPGEAEVLESDWELDATTDGSTLRAGQPLDIKRPPDLADLIEEQQLRIEIEGVVLFDKQIRHGGGDVLIVLPASVRELRLRTARGDLVATDLEGVRLEGSTGHGGITLGGSLGGAKVKTGHGDIVCRLVAAEGDHELHTGRGNIVLDLHGSVAARIDASTRHGGAERPSDQVDLSPDAAEERPHWASACCCFC